MKKNLRLLLSFTTLTLLSACAIEVNPKPLQVEGTVYHEITVDSNLLSEFYTSYCQNQLGPNATQSDLNQCVGEQLANFWLALNSAMPKPSPTATPSN